MVCTFYAVLVVLTSMIVLESMRAGRLLTYRRAGVTTVDTYRTIVVRLALVILISVSGVHAIYQSEKNLTVQKEREEFCQFLDGLAGKTKTGDQK